MGGFFMPYKDKAKKAQWEREHRGAGTQRKIWWGYLYFDSAPDDWETRIRESGYECVWACHDRDERPTGEKKEAHVHVAVRFSHAVFAKEAKAVLTSFGVKEASVQYRDSWRAVCRYMTHMDDPDKYQYEPSIVRECGGADWRSEVVRTSDKYKTIAEMMAWVEDPANDKANGCPAQFPDLLHYARDNQQEWFAALCDNCAIIMREYCKGLRHDWRDERFEAFGRGAGAE